MPFISFPLAVKDEVSSIMMEFFSINSSKLVIFFPYFVSQRKNICLLEMVSTGFDTGESL